MPEKEKFSKNSEIKSVKYESKIDMYSVMRIEKARLFKKATDTIVKKDKESFSSGEPYLPAIKYIVQARAGGIFRYPRGETYQLHLSELGIHIIARDQSAYDQFWQEIIKLSSKK